MGPRSGSSRSKPAPESSNGVVVFRDDEDGYLGWVAANPYGFVVSVPRSGRASAVRLHRATCPTIDPDSSTNVTRTLHSMKGCCCKEGALRSWARSRSESGVRSCITCGRVAYQPDEAGNAPAEPVTRHTSSAKVSRAKPSAGSPCPYCGRRKKGLAEHIRAKHPDLPVSVPPSRTEARKSLSGQAGEPPRPRVMTPVPHDRPSYACPICSAGVDDVAEHLTARHGYARFACPRCAGTIFMTLGDSVACPTCRHKFTATATRRVPHA